MDNPNRPAGPRSSGPPRAWRAAGRVFPLGRHRTGATPGVVPPRRPSAGIGIPGTRHVSTLSGRIGNPSVVGPCRGGRRRGVRACRLLAEAGPLRDRRALLPLRAAADPHPCAPAAGHRPPRAPRSLRRGERGGTPPPPRRVLLHPARVPASGALRDGGGQGRGGERRRLPDRLRGRGQPLRPHARPLPRREPHPARGGHHVGIEHASPRRAGIRGRPSPKAPSGAAPGTCPRSPCSCPRRGPGSCRPRGW